MITKLKANLADINYIQFYTHKNRWRNRSTNSGYWNRI